MLTQRTRSAAVATVAAALAVTIAPPAQAAPGLSGVVWVTSTTTSDIAAFDAGSGDVLARIPVGAKPIDLVAAPGTGEVYVSNEDSGTVSVIDRSSLRVVDTIPVGAKPHHMDVSPDGRIVYVALFGGNHVAYVDTRTHTSTTYVSGPPGSRTHAPDVSLDGRTLYLTNADTNVVQALDARTGAPLWAAQVGTNPSEVLADGHQVAYVSIRNEDKLQLLDLDTHLVSDGPLVGDMPDTLTFGDAGHALVVALRGTPGQVSLVDLDSPELTVRSVPVGGTSTGHQDMSAGGRYAFVAVVGGPSPGAAAVDVRDGEVVARYAYPGGGTPHGVAVTAAAHA
jgi:YVTN family beta-propeller protein